MPECRTERLAFVFGVFGADLDIPGLAPVADGVMLAGTDGAGHARDVFGMPVFVHGGC